MYAKTTVVVGAGSSGGAIAGRLSEDSSRRVIVIEAGPDYPDESALPPTLRDPLGPDLTSHDWGFHASFIEPAEQRAPVPYPRGKVMGGSSLVNGAVAVRGNPGDYEDWAKAGAVDWGWDRVLPYFRCLEADRDFAGAAHGQDGPVPILRDDPDRWPSVLRAFVTACQQRGFPLCPDHNDPAGTGVGPLPRNDLDGVRASTLQTYINPVRNRPNLEIRAQTRVTRVALDGNRVIGVEVISEAGREELAAEQVVLAAGAIMSPHILMLSGIGPRETLERVGISCIADLPQVGRSLCDHAMAPFVAVPPAGVAWPTLGFKAMLKYGSRHGMRATDLFILAALLKTESLNFATRPEADTIFTFATVLGRPHSRGWLIPISADPLDPPDIHMNFLSDPRDLEALAEVMELAWQLLTTGPLSEELGEVLVPTEADMADRASVERWLRANVTTGFHATGTCRMGAPDDDETVVDQRDLRVKGFDGLYVADASIMPDITSGLTNLTCFMIGERFADLVGEPG